MPYNPIETRFFAHGHVRSPDSAAVPAEARSWHTAAALEEKKERRYSGPPYAILHLDDFLLPDRGVPPAEAPALGGVFLQEPSKEPSIISFVSHLAKLR